MSFTAALELIRTHCTTAGAAATPAITVVRLCDLTAPDRQITVEYDGDADSPFGPHTLDATQVGEKVTITAYLPVSNFDREPLEATEAALQDIKARIKSALYGDKTLGGNCVDLEIGAASTEKVQFTGPNGEKGPYFRVVKIPVVLGFEDVDTIAE